MREIKFRGWHPSTKEMLYVTQPYEIALLWEIKYLETKRNNIKNNIEVMQYSGLEDKNGNEIYEGDIIKALKICGLDIEVEKIFIVEFDDGAFKAIANRDGNYISFYLGEYTKWENGECEIIGNIYENQKLLEKTGFPPSNGKLEKEALKETLLIKEKNNEQQN